MAERLDPPVEDCPENRREEDHQVDPRTEGPKTKNPQVDHQLEPPPDKPPGVDIPENIWRWIVYLKRKICSLESEAQINKRAAVSAKAQKELDIAKFEAGMLSGVVTKLQMRLDRLGELKSTGSDQRSNGSDGPPPLRSRSDDSWGPGRDPGRSLGRIKAPRIDHAPSFRGSC